MNNPRLAWHYIDADLTTDVMELPRGGCLVRTQSAVLSGVAIVSMPNMTLADFGLVADSKDSEGDVDDE